MRLTIGDLMRNAPIIHRFEALGLPGYLPSEVEPTNVSDVGR